MIVQQNIKSTDIKLPALSLSKDLETIITCPLGGITTIVCYLYSNVAPLVTSKIVQNKMPHSLDWNRDFRYRRNSGATMWMRGESPAGLFNALTMPVL